MESIAKVEKIIAAEEPAPGDYEKRWPAVLR